MSHQIEDRRRTSNGLKQEYACWRDVAGPEQMHAISATLHHTKREQPILQRATH
ncbi:hypothetical protein ACP_0951 [Acidobacterium capsulatum ATCC 51196]|uniref:Uncharacterized protein n=1 Tax=Acidobacterium capsulatum (strain ATCC 51196 / DSM 11244 / BCRC 80197 / JCM 7670 / NBRC 15755 / NCIMB 13165 / 161) TaxID=240015 RepID=C1F3G2_ACIC5|nr:hypothetical protein ACP_0951 [Acidobacterium capsulatum ATCC 51196]